MHIEKVTRCSLIDDDVAMEGCSCSRPCDHAYVVHILYKEVDGVLTEWEEIPQFVIRDPVEDGWKTNERRSNE